MRMKRLVCKAFNMSCQMYDKFDKTCSPGGEEFVKTRKQNVISRPHYPGA